ncbi:MAG: sulfite exporter TauE/SafE family protein [Glaciecola sp.]
MIILGFLAAVLMGVVLGTIGGGGSILTVPILVYLLEVEPSTATGYSLLIVGFTAAFGAIRYYKQGLIDVKSAITFAIPSIIAVYVTRAFIMPAIPDVILESPFILRKDMLIMVSFGVLMLASAIMMLTKKAPQNQQGKHNSHSPVLIILEGAVVGVATGLLGAGGGFLIIPALVLLMGMEMKKAVGASLMIIALKSLIGFVGDLQAGIHLDWTLIGSLIACTIIGMFLATRIADRLDGNKLQKGFAIFTLAIAILIFIKELI